MCTIEHYETRHTYETRRSILTLASMCAAGGAVVWWITERVPMGRSDEAYIVFGTAALGGVLLVAGVWLGIRIAVARGWMPAARDVETANVVVAVIACIVQFPVCIAVAAFLAYVTLIASVLAGTFVLAVGIGTSLWALTGQWPKVESIVLGVLVWSSFLAGGVIFVLWFALAGALAGYHLGRHWRPAPTTPFG
jgi:hypothetical protein